MRHVGKQCTTSHSMLQLSRALAGNFRTDFLERHHPLFVDCLSDEQPYFGGRACVGQADGRRQR